MTAVSDQPPTLSRATDGSRWSRVVVAVLGMTSVVPLLAWVYGLGPFHVWLLAVTLPGIVGLATFYVVSKRRGWEDCRTAIIVGAFAGLVGTLGYDLFRIPFVFGAGLRLLSPIESYGVLGLNTSTSSPLTDFAGWAYHIANGVGFGITYAAVALRRKWPWGLAWAMVLETGTILTPFATAYGLWGNHTAIGLAYLAHIPYGLALGLIVQHADPWREGLQSVGRYFLPVSLGAVALGLGLWLRPADSLDWAEHRRKPPPVTIQGGRFVPEWSRIGPGDCISLGNSDDRSYAVGPDQLVIEPGAVRDLCFDTWWVHRVRTGSQPFDGGFVIVDPQLG